mmetsp:Transcript_54739/g.168647  ORF Transcript_54739/g.168647 Transcript_54739/m.168647 type:complete len:212 (-) Transcript_54739:210-845(-)
MPPAARSATSRAVRNAAAPYASAGSALAWWSAAPMCAGPQRNTTRPPRRRWAKRTHGSRARARAAGPSWHTAICHSAKPTGDILEAPQGGRRHAPAKTRYSTVTCFSELFPTTAGSSRMNPSTASPSAKSSGRKRTVASGTQWRREATASPPRCESAAVHTTVAPRDASSRATSKATGSSTSVTTARAPGSSSSLRRLNTAERPHPDATHR